MRVIITAVGPNHWGLADPVVKYITSVGACIAEIQMYDHDGSLFAMLLHLKWPATANTLPDLRAKMADIGREHGLSIRTRARDEQDRPPGSSDVGRLTPALHAHARGALRSQRLGHTRLHITAHNSKGKGIRCAH
jgi:predicted amino acid-binding ACT domain protein